MSSLEPQVACLHNPGNVKPVSAVADMRINQAFLGSCTNARLEEFAVASDILRGRKVHPDTRLIVTPASHEVRLEATRAGYIETLIVRAQRSSRCQAGRPA
ncbi:MAG TPA: aconitase family protein [Polyangiaceae bacterium]